MKKTLNNLAHTGIVAETKEAQFITSTNWASIIALAVTFPYIFIYHYLDVSSLVLVNLICLLLYPITIILNKYQLMAFMTKRGKTMKDMVKKSLKGCC